MQTSMQNTKSAEPHALSAELHALNSELHAMNGELHAMNGELHTVTAELRARCSWTNEVPVGMSRAGALHQASIVVLARLVTSRGRSSSSGLLCQSVYIGLASLRPPCLTLPPAKSLRQCLLLRGEGKAVS